MYINVSIIAASLALLCSSNAGILAAPVASEHQQQQQRNQEIEKRTPGLPYGITTAQFLAATAVGVGAGGSIVQVMKALGIPKKSPHWEYDVDGEVENVVGGGE